MALSRWMKDKGVTGWLLALTVGRRVCIYRVHRLPFLIPFSIFILRTALERDTEKVERGRGSGGHTHLSQTRPHTGAHILRDGDTPVRTVFEEAAHQPAEPDSQPREHWSRWMERGATGGGGRRCAPLGLAAHKLTRLIRIHLLKRGRK